MFAKNFSSYISKVKVGLVGLSAAVVGSGLFVSQQQQHAVAGEALQPAYYPWSHRYPWQAFDHASIRRGFQVYRQVCASCHSVHQLAYRNLVNSCYTEEEVKQIAAEADIEDGPNKEGENFTRPGKLSDRLPKPYANEAAARYTNNGALPPDLSLIIKARERHADYLFSLLTGYKNPPAGFELKEGAYYNPYFPGGALAMPPGLTDGQLTFDDGTYASISQMSKDVATFLSWVAEPEHDTRKEMGMKAILVLSLAAIPTFYWKRLVFTSMKTKVVSFRK